MELNTDNIEQFKKSLIDHLSVGRQEDYVFDGQDEIMVESFDLHQACNSVLRLLKEWNMLPGDIDINKVLMLASGHRPWNYEARSSDEFIFG
jgi:hypothetical protein